MSPLNVIIFVPPDFDEQFWKLIFIFLKLGNGDAECHVQRDGKDVRGRGLEGLSGVGGGRFGRSEG